MNLSDDLKHDGGKPRFELIDPYALLSLAMVLTAGAAEYEAHGWRSLNTFEGRERVIGAAHRHLNKIERGERYDPSFGGLPHASHLMACAMFLAAWDMEAFADMDGDGELQALQERWEDRVNELAAAKAENARKAKAK